MNFHTNMDKFNELEVSLFGITEEGHCPICKCPTEQELCPKCQKLFKTKE